MEKLIPNSTQIPNEICDYVLPQIPEAEARCLIYICRRTFGFRKTQDRISFSQFEKGIKTKDGNILDYGTGLSRPAVAKALKNLCESGAIKRTENSKGNFYEINLEMECSQVVKQINWLSSLTKSGKATLPKVVNLLNTQNKEKQRETKKNTAATAATRLDFQKLVDYFFELKGWANKEKSFYKQERIVYARYLRPAKELMSLCEGNLDEAKICLKKVSDWAQSRDLDWSIETIFKKWYDIDKLKPKEKKPYYRGNRVFEICGRKYVLMPNGEKLEFAGSEKEITFK